MTSRFTSVRAAVALACAASLWSAPAAAQTPSTSAAPPQATVPGDDARQPGSELTVYLLTMGAGDAIWEKFGHNALWIHDARTGTDVAYNWGMFDFASEDFIPRFLQGRMRYWMEAFPLEPMVQAYVETNRSVWAQELALTAAEKRALNEFVTWNAREENKYYTYDYYRDNCSTRVRDALDRVLGGRLRAETDTIPSGTTWRWHTRRLTQDAQPIYTGIDVMLAAPADRPISAWEEMFLPMRLRDRVRELRVAGENGEPRPFVVSERQLFAATRPAEPAQPSRLLPVYVALGAVLALILGGLAAAAARGQRGARVGFVTMGTLWSVLAGIAGTLMLLTWLFTDHVVAHANENLLQLSPLSLVLAVLLPIAVLRGPLLDGGEYRDPSGAARPRDDSKVERRKSVIPSEARDLGTRVRREIGGGTASRLAVAVAALAVLGLMLQGLPLLDQVNGQTIALALPPHLALAWGTWTLSARPRSPRMRPAIAPPSPGHRVPGSAASVPGGAAQ